MKRVLPIAFATLTLNLILLSIPVFAGHLPNPSPDTLTHRSKADEVRILLQRAKKTAEPSQAARLYFLAAEAAHHKEQYPDAVVIFNEAVKRYTAIGDSVELGKTYNYLGVDYMNLYQYDLAIKNLQQAIDIRRRNGDETGVASSMNNLGLVYKETGQYDKALRTFEQCLAVFRKAKDEARISATLNNLGQVYNLQEKYFDALEKYSESLDIKLRLKDTVRIATTRLNVATIQIKIKNYKQARENIVKALEIYEKNQFKSGLASSYNLLAKVAMGQGFLSQAKKYATTSNQYAEELRLTSIVVDNLDILSEYYLATGNLLESRDMMAQKATLVEQLFRNEISQKVANLTVQFESQQKDQDTQLLQSNLQLETLRMQRAKDTQMRIFLLIAFALVVLVISFLAMLKLRQKGDEINKINKQLVALNKELEEKVALRTEELTEALRRAEDADNLKTAFLANMSHEIRTPMNGILGFAKLLDDEELPPHIRRQYIEIINHRSQSLLTQINDIVNIAKLETEQMEIKLSFCNINALLTEQLTTFNNRLRSKHKSNLEIRMVKALSDAQARIITDPLRLEQIIFSLLDNAVKFTDAGVIEFGYTLEQKSTLRFFVKDTGIGIPLVEQEKIFVRFHQIPRRQDSELKGTGLGLAISKGLVKLLGGEIWVDSEEGLGSTFYFTIPYKPSDAVGDDQLSKANIQRRDFNWGTKAILVVEDDLISFQYIEALLRKTGVRLVHVKNGEDAVEACSLNESFNLVLMDIQLPFMNGYEATSRIKKLRPELPVIALTANVMANDKDLCLKSGCCDYIGKPIDPDELLVAVASYLEAAG